MDDMLPGHYGKVSLDDMQLVGAPVYRLSMIAEAYATKGTNAIRLFIHSIHSFFSLYIITAFLCNSCSHAVLHVVAALHQYSSGSSGLMNIELNSYFYEK